MKHPAILFFLFFLFSHPALARDYYFSPTGIDGAGCDTGGSRANPWQSISVKYRRGCIVPGDRIILKAGNYYSSNLYPFKSARIGLEGSANNPITIMADPNSDVEYPAKLRGSFIITSKYLIIEGLEFIRERDDSMIVSIGESSHVSIENSSIHGDIDDWNSATNSSTEIDCVKIAGGLDLVEHITIKNSEIYNCSGDAIDVTGRKNITYIGNHIHHARGIKVKGGSENILISHNYIHDMVHGVRGQGMNCTQNSTPKYCGNPELPSLPMKDRFQAKNVSVINNFFENISGVVIEISGWRNVAIRDNTFVNSAFDLNSPYIVAREQVSFAFDKSFTPSDRYVEDYCRLHPSECKSCGGSVGHCVRLRADNIHIAYNKFFHEPAKNAYVRMVIEANAMKRAEGLCFSTTNYFDNQSVPKYIVEHTTGSISNAPNPKGAGFCLAPPMLTEEITNQWKRLSASNYSSMPVVIATPPTYNDSAPGVVAIRNKSIADGVFSFDVAFKEWEYLTNQTHNTESASFLLLPAGVHRMEDGAIWVVGTQLINKSGSQRWDMKRVNFPTDARLPGKPHVFLTLQSQNGPETVVARVDEVSSSGFMVTLQEQKSTARSDHTSEEVGYLAIYNPNDGGWAKVSRNHTFSYQLAGLGVNSNFRRIWGVDLKMEEENSTSDGVSHLVENVNVLLINDKVFAQDVDFLGSDTAALRQKISSGTPSN